METQRSGARAPTGDPEAVGSDAPAARATRGGREGRGDAVERLVKLGTPVLALVTLIASVTQFLYTQRAEAERRERELALQQLQRIYEDRTRRAEQIRGVLQRVVRAAGTLAESPDGPEAAAARAEFWRLYFGEMILIGESEEVEAAMVRFGRALNDPAPTVDGDPRDSDSKAGASEVVAGSKGRGHADGRDRRVRLRQEAVELAKACTEMQRRTEPSEVYKKVDAYATRLIDRYFPGE